MWSSEARAAKLAIRSAAMALAVGVTLTLAACTGFTPVYNSGSFTTEKIELAIGSPSNRTEQIIYQDLRLRFAKPAGPAPTLTVSTVSTSVALTSQIVTTAQTPYQATVTAAVKLTDASGKVLYSGSLAQSADYNTGPQVLANNAAADDAVKRAAHLLADTIRLTVLGKLSP